MSNKRRKLDSFKLDCPKTTYYCNTIDHYEENYEDFLFPKKSCGQLIENEITTIKVEREKNKQKFSLEYSQDENYDYPDILGEDMLEGGNQIIDFGMNEFPSCDNQLKIDYESIDFKEFIGQGNFSDVWSARLETDIDSNEEEPLFAVKVLKSNKGMNIPLESFLNELEIIRKLNKDENPNVLKLIGFCKTPQLCIITELMDISLYDLIHHPSKSIYLDKLENQIKIGLYIARGILGINEKSNILHNDLTSKNILLKSFSLQNDQVDYLVKITDFGLSSFIHSSSGPTKRGNARWRSPEQTLSNLFSKKGEVWSFGVIFWEILTKQLPYPSIKESKLVAEKVSNKTLSLDIPSSLPAPLSDLLNDCLLFDYEKRTSISNVVSVLENFYSTTFHENI